MRKRSVSGFATRGRGGSKLTTVICEDCGLVYTNPRPTERENAKFYHTSYWGAYKNQSMPDESFFRRRLPKIRPMLTQLRPYLKPGVRVLEIGCSVGALLWSMKEVVGSTGHFTGIEPHEGHAQFAREKKDWMSTTACWRKSRTSSSPRASTSW